MPQLVALALVGGVAWYAWRSFKKEMTRLNQQDTARQPADQRKARRLEKGADGVWRPSKDA